MATAVIHPITSPTHVSIPGRFATVAARHADRIAVRAPRGHWTYAELDQRSQAIAGRLLNNDAVSPAPVALLMEHDAPQIAAILGVLKAGRMFLALDPATPEKSLIALLADARAEILLTDKTNLPLARSLASDGLPVLEVEAAFADGPGFAALPEVSSMAGASLVYTSGSTGAPKGVWQNHAGTLHHAGVYADLIQLTPDDRLSLLTSCSLAAALTPLFAALLHGAALGLFHVRSQGVERLAAWLRAERITVYHSVPTVFRHLLRAMPDDRPVESMRLIRLGGEPAFRTDAIAVQQRFPAGCRLMHALSSTETGLISSWMMDRQTPLPDSRLPAGRAVAGVEVQLLNERHEPVAAGEAGRIAVRSEHLAQGYWRQPDATAAAFVTDPRHPSERTFLTGDLGRLRPDGCLEHLGRADRQVKIRGHRVDLNEVESALQTMDAIAEAAVVAQEDRTGEQQLIAYIVALAGSTVNPRELRRALLTQVPAQSIPSHFVPLAGLPLTDGGKLDRRSLPSWRAKPGDRAKSRLVPRDHIEVTLTRIWQSVLGLNAINRRDDFFDLGGSSLNSARILSQVQDRYDLALPPGTLFEHNTIEKLAAMIAGHTVQPSAGPLVVLRAADAGRPLFFVHNGNGDVTTYVALARRLSGRPIYGLQAAGLDGREWPLLSVTRMAQRYLREVIAADPTGPYLLASTCMGGLVAFEMARQLVASGRQVSWLALMDAPVAARRSMVTRLSDSVRDLVRLLRGAAIRGLMMTSKTRWLPSCRRFVARMNASAAQHYRPEFYPGTVIQLLTSNIKCSEVDRHLELGRHARETRTITISGSRADLFVPPMVDELARHLQKSLEEIG